MSHLQYNFGSNAKSDFWSLARFDHALCQGPKARCLAKMPGIACKFVTGPAHGVVFNWRELPRRSVGRKAGVLSFTYGVLADELRLPSSKTSAAALAITMVLI